MRYLIGTRGSKLALVQTDYVIDKLKRAYPDDDFKAVIIKTTGDLEQKKALDKIGSKGIFVKEIEDELLSGKICLMNRQQGLHLPRHGSVKIQGMFWC